MSISRIFEIRSEISRSHLEIKYLEIYKSLCLKFEIDTNTIFLVWDFMISKSTISRSKFYIFRISRYFFNIEIKKSRSLKFDIDTAECFLFWDFIISRFTISRSNLGIHIEILSNFLEIFLEINKYRKKLLLQNELDWTKIWSPSGTKFAIFEVDLPIKKHLLCDIL